MPGRISELRDSASGWKSLALEPGKDREFSQISKERGNQRTQSVSDDVWRTVSCWTDEEKIWSGYLRYALPGPETAIGGRNRAHI